MKHAATFQHRGTFGGCMSSRICDKCCSRLTRRRHIFVTLPIRTSSLHQRDTRDQSSTRHPEPRVAIYRNRLISRKHPLSFFQDLSSNDLVRPIQKETFIPSGRNFSAANKNIFDAARLEFLNFREEYHENRQFLSQFLNLVPT